MSPSRRYEMRTCRDGRRKSSSLDTLLGVVLGEYRFCLFLSFLFSLSLLYLLDMRKVSLFPVGFFYFGYILLKRFLFILFYTTCFVVSELQKKERKMLLVDIHFVIVYPSGFACRQIDLDGSVVHRFGHAPLLGFDLPLQLWIAVVRRVHL
jgi:hypothetical protein